MRPTFLGFETGRKGLSVSQKGLDLTGNNLANVGTPGYTRQRVDQVSVAPMNGRSRFAVPRADYAGQGVNITGVGQTRDSYLDKRFREEFSDNYYYSQKTAILDDIASVMDEFKNGDSGLLMALNKISSALSDCAGAGDDTTLANILRTSFQGMVAMLHEYSVDLDKVAEQQKYDLGIGVDYVNNTLAKIAGLNKEIAADLGCNPADANVYGPNELLDERNLLLDELSRYGDIKINNEPNGSISVFMGGHQVVKGDQYDTVIYTQHEAGTVALSWQSDGKDVVLGSGAFKAYTEVLNGRGANIQSKYESTERGVLYYKDRLDSLARTLADVVNNVIPAKVDENGEPVPGVIGVDANGNDIMGTNPNKVYYKPLLGALVKDQNGKYITSQNIQVTAENISITDDWAADSTYVIPRKKSFSGGNYFTLMNTQLRTNKNTNFYNNGQAFTGSFDDYLMDCSNTCGADVSFNVGRMDATGAIADDLLNRRDSISGVSRDEETTNMMMYQKSFQAMSRLMTAMDESLDTIINKMGLVGR